MAFAISIFLVYSKRKIAAEKLQDKPVSLRAQIRFTRSALTWSMAKRVGHQVERIQFTTPIKVQPRYWRSGSVKPAHPGAAEINSAIARIIERATAAHSRYVADGVFPSETDFISACLGIDQEKATKHTLFGYYRLFISYLIDRGVSKATIERHEYIFERLERFESETGYHLEFDTINKTFSAKFTAWCGRAIKPRRETQNMEMTAQRYLKDIRLFVGHAYSEGWTSANLWRQIKPKFPKNTFPITVTEDEIQNIASLKIEDFKMKYRGLTKNILITRDWFILGTQTAMRWSDWHNRRFRFVRNSAGIDLQFTQEKTDDPLQIPLSPLAIEILSRYDFDMPAVFSPPATGQHLRHIAAAAGIDKHITTHTARRTFCTLQEAAGVPRGIIMRITGHRTEKDYLRYTGISFRYNADMLRKANAKMFKTAG